MEERIGNKPEAIAYLRSQYSSDALPDWVGKFRDKVDYAEILRREGIELPFMMMMTRP